MKKLLSLLIVTALVLTNSFSIAFADEIENTETTTTLDSSIFEDLDYSYLGEECNESNIETDYNLYDELDYHECEAVYDWIYETYNVSHSDEEANQFIWNNINKFILLAIENEIVIYPKMSTFWFGDTHKNIFDKSVDALKEYSTNVYNFYKNSSCYDNLRTYTEEPDTTEKADGTHYYVYTGTLPNNGDYYKNRNTALIGNNSTYSISARTRFEEHYFTAVNLYKNGYKNQGIKELGYALHYLQDIGCPPHAAGDEWKENDSTDPHWAYEDFVENTFLPYYSTTAYSYSATVIDNVLLENIGTNLNALAKTAKEAYDDYAGVMTTTSFGTAANTTMKKTQEYTTAYLIKFYNDVNSSSTPYIKNNTQYLIKNKATGKYLCNNSNDNLTWSSTATSNCIFYTEITGHSFAIKSGNMYVYIANAYNINAPTLASSLSSSADFHFKFVYDENGSYKIFYAAPVSSKYKGSPSFERVLYYNSLYPQGQAFTPSLSCYWEFVKV